MKDNKLPARVQAQKGWGNSDYNLVKIRTEHNGLSTLKTLITLFIVFAQLGIIISLNFFFAMGLRWYLVVLAVISVITAVCVLSSHRSTQTKAIWVLFILVFFVFGFVVYYMSDDRIMYGRARKRHRKIFEKTKCYAKEYNEPNANSSVITNCRYLHNSGGFVPYTNTDVHYFPSANSMFDDVIEKLKDAKQFVFIEYFAIADGALLKRILNILLQKMKEGVDVRIIYDDMGSRVLSLKTRKLIKKSGGQIRVFNKLLSRFTFSLNYRDHRKIIVIDGRVAYTGGCNLADEYINEKRMHGYWKDAGLRMTGEGVDALTLTFLRQWEFIVRKNIQYEQFLNHWEKAQSTSTVIPYVGGPEFEQPICKSVYENVITSAKRKLYIMTPYFVPDESIMQDIVNAALSGVDVRLVLPAIPDKLYVYLLTRDNAEKLTKYGVKVYYVEDAFVHSKVVLSESCAIIGSANFDMRSFFQQFENCVLTDDSGLMGDVERDFEQVFADSLLVEKQQKRGLFNAIAVSALRLVGPLM